MARPIPAQPIVLWISAEAKGTVAPCGCTTDPLGGLDRVAALVRREKGPHGLIYPGALGPPAEEIEPAKKAEVEGRKGLLERTFRSLGWMRPGTHKLGEVRIAVLEATSDKIPPRPKGVDVAIALVPLPKVKARKLLREARGIDLAVVAMDVGDGDSLLEQVGSAYLIRPAAELQRLFRLELHVARGSKGLKLVGGVAEHTKQEEEIRSLEKQIAEWKAAKDADPAYIAERQKELEALKRAESTVPEGKTMPPQGVSWFTSELVAIRQKLPSDARVSKTMKELDRKLGVANRKRDCERPPPESTEPHYVGASACANQGCHPQAVALWKKTVHGQAWKTLLDDGRAFSLECIGCHVTGFGDAARKGATLCKPEPMVDVQCEVCHGPASAHVAAEGIEDKPSVTKKPADDLCATQCHTPQHSDTFQLEAYLRDILGPGHGAKRKEKLGPGPTGRELREAGLKKAGRH